MVNPPKGGGFAWFKSHYFCSWGCITYCCSRHCTYKFYVWIGLVFSLTFAATRPLFLFDMICVHSLWLLLFIVLPTKRQLLSFTFSDSCILLFLGLSWGWTSWWTRPGLGWGRGRSVWCTKWWNIWFWCCGYVTVNL